MGRRNDLRHTQWTGTLHQYGVHPSRADAQSTGPGEQVMRKKRPTIHHTCNRGRVYYWVALCACVTKVEAVGAGLVDGSHRDPPDPAIPLQCLERPADRSSPGPAGVLDELAFGSADLYLVSIDGDLDEPLQYQPLRAARHARPGMCFGPPLQLDQLDPQFLRPLESGVLAGEQACLLPCSPKLRPRSPPLPLVALQNPPTGLPAQYFVRLVRQPVGLVHRQAQRLQPFH